MTPLHVATLTVLTRMLILGIKINKSDLFTIKENYDCLLMIPLMVHFLFLISSARVLSSMSSSTSMRVSQSTGFFPVPWHQVNRISRVIAGPSLWCLCTILAVMVPLVSSKMRWPNISYCAPIIEGIHIFLPSFSVKDSKVTIDSSVLDPITNNS